MRHTVCEAYEQYRLAIAMRTEDSSRAWTVFGLMSALNGALIALLGTRHVEIPQPLMSTFGVILCLFWLNLQLRFAACVRQWELKAEELELHIPEKLHLFSKRRFQCRCPFVIGFSTRLTTFLLPLLFACAWMVLALWGETS